MVCEGGSWTAPTLLTLSDPERPSIAFRFSSGAYRRQQLVLAGNHIPNVFTRSPAWGEVKIVRNSRLLPAPVNSLGGAERVVQPKVTIGPRNEIHLLWAEAASGPPRNSLVGWLAPRADALWATRYSSTRGWAPPERILDGAMIWGKSFVDEPSASDSMIVVAVRRLVSAAGLGVVSLLVFDGRRWNERQVPGTENALMTSVTTDGQRIAMAFARPAKPISQGFDLALVSSADGGITWSAPRTVYSSVHSSASALRVRWARDRSLRVVLVDESPSGGANLRLVAVDGETDSTASVRLPRGVNGLQIAEDTCGQLHLVFESYDPRTGQGSLMHARWSGAWSIVPLAPMLRALDVVLLATDDRALQVFFLGQPQNASPRSDYSFYTMSWMGTTPPE